MPRRTPKIDRARALRQAVNTPEDRAWQALRKLRVYGYPVRRQHPISIWFADFAIVRAKLVIEIDGSIHDGDLAKQKGAARQAGIERLGWRVIRIPARAAMDADHVWSVVTAELGL